MPNFDDFETATGILFQDKTLLQRAFTHRSFVNESLDFPVADNERLEFLGDAVLDFVVGDLLYHRLPELREGDLTALRAALVRRDTLASFAGDWNLGEYLLMGQGELVHGGRERPATLCATFEALVGAVYLDQGLEAAKRLIYRYTEPELERIRAGELQRDPKSRLQEWSQSTLKLTPAYVTTGQSGPDHAREFVVEVQIGGETYGRGEGRTKQIAAQTAAEQAMQTLEERGECVP